MSLEETRQLSPTELHDIVVLSFERRLQHATNILYESRTSGSNYKLIDDQIGELLASRPGDKYHHWQLGSSYRKDTEVTGKGGKGPQQFISVNWDDVDGRMRGTHRTPASEVVECRIDVSPDPKGQEDRYQYWLDGANVRENNRQKLGEFIIRYVVDHKEMCTVELPPDEKYVTLSVPWQPVCWHEPIGVRTFELDPERGFLPVHGKGNWNTKLPDGSPFWRSEEFFVEDSKLVGDVWMPVKLKELISCSSVPGEVTVWETMVGRIESGNVKPRDIDVAFLPGARVIDATKAIHYVVGPNGEHTRVQPALVSVPNDNIPVQQGRP